MERFLIGYVGEEGEGGKTWLMTRVAKDEKKEGGKVDWFWTCSEDIESDETGRLEADGFTRITFVIIVFKDARRVPRSVKKNPNGVK